VPRFEFHGRPSALFGRSFCGYPKLPGEPAIRLALEPRDLEAFAEPLASFLQALHRFPVTTARALGVPEEPVDQAIEEIRDDALGDLVRVEAIDTHAPTDRWRRFIERGVDLSNRCAPVVIHNDFAAEHVLVDARTSTISGVIDWSDVAIGDPAADFAGLFHWGGEELAEAVAAAYAGSLDAGALIRARYLGACRGAMDVAFGLDEGRPEYVAAGLRALRLCAGE
jgi:aminoglycoside phosphotransferase (APT) family kinase protein